MTSVCREYDWRNVVLSPFSIQQVFGVLYLGSDGNTARQINNYLGLNSASAPWLAETITSLKGDKNCVTFNSLVVNRYFSVDQRFLKAVRNYYASKLYWADFECTGKAAPALNRFIEVQSRGIFKDLLTPADVSPDTVMAIMNVLYYKSDWRYKFDRNQTVQLNFTNAYNQNRLVNMMFLKKVSAVFL
jgi:serpin B